MYMVTGDEEIIFLYVNNGEKAPSAVPVHHQNGGWKGGR